MKKIRKGVFETNSSSMHSVVIDKDCKLSRDYLYVDDDNFVHTYFDEYGWGYNSYGDANGKLSYLVTMIGSRMDDVDISGYEDISVEEINEALNKNEEFKKLNEVIKECCECDGIWVDESCGYVDHQSVYETLDEFLEDWNLESLEEFIFNEKYVMVTDNDN